MDLNKMMKLMDMKKTFGISKSLMRVFFALMCGTLFHVAFFLYNVKHANVSTFTVCLIIFYYILDWVEETQFTKPIEVSIPNPVHLILPLTQSLLFINL